MMLTAEQFLTPYPPCAGRSRYPTWQTLLFLLYLSHMVAAGSWHKTKVSGSAVICSQHERRDLNGTCRCSQPIGRIGWTDIFSFFNLYQKIWTRKNLEKRE